MTFRTSSTKLLIASGLVISPRDAQAFLKSSNGVVVVVVVGVVQCDQMVILFFPIQAINNGEILSNGIRNSLSRFKMLTNIKLILN